MIGQDQAIAIGVNWEDQAPVILGYSDGQWGQVPSPGVGGGYALYDLFIRDEENGLAVGVDIENTKGALAVIQDGEWLLGTVPEMSADWDLTAAATLEGQSILVGRDFENNAGVIVHGIGMDYSGITAPFVSADWMLNSVVFTGTDQALAAGYDGENQSGLILNYQEGNWIVEMRTEMRLATLRIF